MLFRSGSDGAGDVINQVLDADKIAGTAVYKITPTLNDCVGKAINVTINVNPLPLPLIVDGVICVEQSTGNTYKTYVLDTGLSKANHSFDWYYDTVKINGSLGNTYEAKNEGVYSVIATNKTTGCVSEEVSATVIENYPADSFTTTISNAFSENASITVSVIGGTGPFLYQLDNGISQSENVFNNVSGGTHKVTLSDEQGCTQLIQDVIVVDYPKFFTPNGDGLNDVWNIKGLANSKVDIYDRYGKLIKQIDTSKQGWDGSLNGHDLPSTDYWFAIEYIESNIQKIFKAHFSLKR